MNEPQIIEKDGKPQYVIVPWEEWRALRDRLELLEDSRAFADIKDRDTEFLPAEVAKSVFAGKNPIGVYRRHRGLTQAGLAEKIGVAKQTISSVESARRRGSIELRRKIAAALNVDLDDLEPAA